MSAGPWVQFTVVDARKPPLRPLRQPAHIIDSRRIDGANRVNAAMLGWVVLVETDLIYIRVRGGVTQIFIHESLIDGGFNG